MRHGFDEDVSIPFAGRKAAPRVNCVVGWTRPAVHPDRRLLFTHREPPTVGNHGLSWIVDLRCEAHLRGARFKRKVPCMRPAHEFRYVEVLRRPALCTQAAGGTERKARVVAVHTAAVFVACERTPHAGDDVRLRERRQLEQSNQRDEQTDSFQLTSPGFGPPKGGPYVRRFWFWAA